MRSGFRGKLLTLTAAVGLIAVGLPATVSAYRAYYDRLARAALKDFLINPHADDMPPAALKHFGLAEDDEAQGDDPMQRKIAMRSMWGAPNAAHKARVAQIAYREAQKWAYLDSNFVEYSDGTVAQRAGDPNAAPPVPSARIQALTWVNMGPTNARFEYNGSQYFEVDSGRIASIQVDPRDARVMYIATSGGGVWKTYNFTGGGADATWHPIFDMQGNTAVGHMALDPSNPDTLYVGVGDAFDVPGGQIHKSTNGGSSWGPPVQLTATYPAGSGGLNTPVSSIRDVKVDPTNPNIVLVATDVGLFRSTDAGASFSVVDLPNSGGVQRAENAWTIAYTGQLGGVSRWAVSGIYACGPGLKPPEPGWASNAGQVTNTPNPGDTCVNGNPGDIWVSTNAGATWTSRRAAGGLPATAVARIALAAGTPKAAATNTVLYAQLGNQDEYNAPASAGYWRSLDSGNTWTTLATGVSNRTGASFGVRDCGDAHVHDTQSWYDMAIAVDPTNDARVLAGGVLCGVRTVSGLAGTVGWDLVSHWLPSGGGGNVTGGQLDYVHADWHRVHIIDLGGGAYRAFAGTDGGLYYSSNVFATGGAVNSTLVNFNFANRGVVTHLAYGVGSGDPATGDPYVAFFGLQDNGTRFREDTGTAPDKTTTFNQVIGGDGFGTASLKLASGNRLNWASVQRSHRYCDPDTTNCNAGGAWTAVNPAACAGDQQPWNLRYSPIYTNTANPAVLSHTERTVARAVNTTWATISPCLDGASGRPNRVVRYVYASDTIEGLYGAALSGGVFGVSRCLNGTAAATCAALANWTFSSPVGFDLDGSGAVDPDERTSYTTMVAFPPTTPGGKNPGDVYLASTAAPVTQDNVTLVPPALGHLFITQDRGATWAPLHGNGTGWDLPNVGINIVRYDPGDLTNNTIYVGTEIGVYRSNDGGQTWERYGIGLPYAQVTDMFISKSGGMLRVGLFGRGLWEIYPSATAEKGVNGNGDFDRDLQIDFLDLAAMAARQGTDPSKTTANPLYDWVDDMTGTVNAIDGNDLTQLLTKFGNTP